MKKIISSFAIDQSEKKNLLFLMLAALLLRLFYIVEITGTPFADFLFSDSKIYYEWAKGMAIDGNWIGDDAFYMAPVYPYFMAVCFKLLGDSLFIIRILQVIFSTATIFFIYLSGRSFHNKNTGYIAATIAVFYSGFIFYSGAILSETLQAFCLSVFVYYLLSSDSSKLSKWLFLGIGLGILSLFRGNILLFFPVVIVYLIFSKKIKELNISGTKAVLLFSAGTLLPILPATIHNTFASDEFVLLTTNGGINFFVGNNEDSPGVYVNPKGFDLSTDITGQKFAAKQTGLAMSPSAASAYWFNRGLKYIIDKPGDAILLYINKTLLFFGESENPQSTIMDIDYFRENYSNILKLPLPGFFVISLFSIVGFIFSIQQRKSFLFLLLVLTYIAGTVIFFVNGRFRIGITPALIILAAYSVVMLFEYIKAGNYRKIKTPAITVGVYLFLYVFVAFKPVFGEYDAYMHLGEIAYEEENYSEAVQYYNRALFYRDSAEPYMNIGNALARNKDFTNAVASFQKAIARDPDNLLAHFNLAFAYTQMGNFEQAINEYNKVINLDPTFVNAYRNMGIAYYVQEYYKEALVYFEKFLSISTDEQVNDLVRKDIENIKLRISLQKEKSEK